MDRPVTFGLKDPPAVPIHVLHSSVQDIQVQQQRGLKNFI
jgi:hypothetical protein